MGNSTFAKSSAGKFLRSPAAVRLTDAPTSEGKTVFAQVKKGGYGYFYPFTSSGVNYIGVTGFPAFTGTPGTASANYTLNIAEPVYTTLTIDVVWNDGGTSLYVQQFDPVYGDYYYSSSCIDNVGNATSSSVQRLSVDSAGTIANDITMLTPGYVGTSYNGYDIPPNAQTKSPITFAFMSRIIPVNQSSSYLSSSVSYTSNGYELNTLTSQSVVVSMADYQFDRTHPTSLWLVCGGTWTYTLSNPINGNQYIQQSMDMLSGITLLDDLLYTSQSYSQSIAGSPTLKLRFPSMIPSPALVSGSLSVNNVRITPNRNTASLIISCSVGNVSCSVDTVGSYPTAPNGIWAVGAPVNQFGLATPTFPTDGGYLIYSAKTVIKSNLGVNTGSLTTYNPSTGLFSSSSQVEQHSPGYYIYDPTNTTPSTGRYTQVVISTPDFTSHGYYDYAGVY